MTLRHMKIFVAVYQQKSITLASNSLHLAQPSVSLAIKERRRPETVSFPAHCQPGHP